MRLESALSLQEEILAGWNRGPSAACAEEVREARSYMATCLGVYVRKPGDYGITVGARNRMKWLADSLLSCGPLAKVPRGEKDVQVTGRVVAAIASKSKPRRTRQPSANGSLQPGDSIGHHLNASGTLGCYVRPVEGADWIGVLSNSHVLTYVNDRTGDDTVIAPGGSDRGKHPPHGFARLRNYVTIDVQPGILNEFDIADAIVDPALRALPPSPRYIPGLGVLSGRVVGVSELPTLVDKKVSVAKRGRSTGTTKGVIKQLNVTLPINYSFGLGVQFDSVIGVLHSSGYRPFAQDGDSGSILVVESGVKDSETGEPLLDAVGLVFAVTTHGRYSQKNPAMTYALPLEPVLKELGIRLY